LVLLKELELFLRRVIGILAVAMVLAACAVARPDRNAFINQKVATTSELVNQARRDKSVMDRYMRHYGMNREEVLAFLGTLKPDAIKEEGIFAIYSVPEGGRIKLHMERLKKGHKVFSSRDGEPQLVLKCGNPLTLGPKSVVALNRTPVTTAEIVVEQSPIEIMTEIEGEIEPLMALQPAEPTYVIIGPPELTPIPIAAGFNPLPLALGGLAFLDTSSSTVPEPMSMVVFGAGLAYLGMRRRKSQKI
jgi:hypothetical protein